MPRLHTYLPQDRVHALAHHTTLPERCVGAALFADISGFTPLTEKLTRELGPRRGAEELSCQINAVYAALIAEIEKHGGSVISFAGDGMLCWFAAGEWQMADSGWPIADSAGHQPSAISDKPSAALPCAFALQTAMQAFPHLGLKVAVTTGPARRLVVGDPAIQQLDILAGLTITRAATAEHLAQRGEVITDEATVGASAAQVGAWRTDPASGERFAVVNQLNQLRVNSEELRVKSAPVASEASQLFTLNSALLTAFLLPAVVERETNGQGVFLTEFRPCVALFVRFVGIAFETDTAPAQLDAFIRLAQALAEQYGGTLLEVTMGDKGNYLYLNWGALSAHEDDARRAVKMALALRQSCALPLQMSLTKGIMRVGAYGGPTRHSYGALGDEVNLAARLMLTAAPGEIVVSGYVYKAVAQHFAFEPRPPLPMKGKADSLPVFAVLGISHQRAMRLQEPTYALPMVGRTHELHLIQEKLDLAWRGQGQVVGIVAEAGLGKSRLVAEVIRTARHQGFVGYGGTCQSDGVNTPYLVWKSIWQAFFEVDPAAPLAEQTHALENHLAHLAPARVPALPLLNIVLDLQLPDSDFTRNLEPKLRQSALHALLEDCAKTATQAAPLLIVLEDVHWIDALAHALLEQLAQALTAHRICFVLAYRPAQLAQAFAARLERLPQFTKIALPELTPAEAEQALRAKLAQLYPVSVATAPPSALVEKITARAQGNPFCLEELLNYVHDQGLDPLDTTALEKIELPDSLHTLILSRVDQLSEREKTTLRVASIIGRLFHAHWLTGYYPALGELTQVKAQLDQLAKLDITPLDRPEPELAYLFKHIITQEVTYESLPFATRAQLHEQLAQYLENAYANALPLETLAFHYARSDNLAKKCEYLRRAADQAKAAYANATAIDYYRRLLPLLPPGAAQIEVRLALGTVLELTGQWAEAEAEYHAALAQAGSATQTLLAQAHQALGVLAQRRGDLPTAHAQLAQARAIWEALAAEHPLSQTLIEIGVTYLRQGQYAAARQHFEMGLACLRHLHDQNGMAVAYRYLGNLERSLGDWPAAQHFYETSLALFQATGNKAGHTQVLNNLGLVAAEQGQFAIATQFYTTCLAAARAIGDQWGVSAALNNLGDNALEEKDFARARAFLAESLNLRQAMGDKWGVVMAHFNLGCVAVAELDSATARACFRESLRLAHTANDHRFRAYGLARLASLHPDPQTAAQLASAAQASWHNPWSVTQQQTLEHTCATARAALGEAAFNLAWAAGEKMPLEAAVQLALQDVS